MEKRFLGAPSTLKGFFVGTIMIIRLNGQDFPLQEGTSIRQLLEQLKVNSDMAAVEVNLKVVPKGAQATTYLQEGDKVEVIRFVGGG